MPVPSYSQLLPAFLSLFWGYRVRVCHPGTISRDYGFSEWIDLGASLTLRSELKQQRGSSSSCCFPTSLTVKLLRGEINGPSRNFIYLPPSMGVFAAAAASSQL